MKSFQFAVFMLFWMSAAPVMPEEAGTLPIPPDTAIKPDHPAYYVVGKEDTLWDIAEVFLEDPWVVTDAWWSQEPFIYLGDIITPANLEEQAVLQI
ncbi:MAG: hypothetical protein GY862_21690, partial [Gammaproteobacteria bacterium]|nr:hypothetical protein [Gammaproteobacteria bacterium]